jgi:LmbE family N-acetylglucosaminyl deacetylase
MPVVEAALRNVVFLFAHQDDEVPLSTRIAREVAGGSAVHCIYLTDGGARSRPEVRDRESQRALERLGIAAERISFLGSRHGIRDGELVGRLPEALELVESETRALRIRRLYCLAFEGGHQDHDASHLLAAALAARRGLLRRTWQHAVYTGRGAPGRLFRVLHPLPRRTRTLTRRLPAPLAWRHAWLVRHYPSQWRTWLGLFPELFLQRALLRRERLQPLDLTTLGDRPHPGPLLYERLFDFPYERFREASRAFVEEHLVRAPGGA